MKTVVKLFLISFFIGFSCISYAGTKTFTLKNFKGIDVSNGLKVTVYLDSVEKVILESDNDQFDDIELKVTNGVLKIRKKMFGKHSSNPHIIVHASYLERFYASGGASIKTVNDLRSDYLSCEVSSGANISLNARCKLFEGKLSSGAMMSMEGSAEVAKIKAGSGAFFKGNNFSCNTVEVDASSGCRINMSVTGEILGNVSSGAFVSIEGKPANHVKISSGGLVQLK